MIIMIIMIIAQFLVIIQSSSQQPKKKLMMILTNYYLNHGFTKKRGQLHTSGRRAGSMTISCNACFAVSCPAENTCHQHQHHHHHHHWVIDSRPI